MSYQLTKILTGAYRFPTAADLQETLKNLRVGGDSNALTVASNATTLDANLGNAFSLAVSASVAITVANMTKGQVVHVIATGSGAGGNITFSGATGDSPGTLSSGNVWHLTFVKVGSTVYVSSVVVTA